MRKTVRLLSLLLSLALVTGLTAPALAAETAAVIRLTKTTGTVEISKSSGKPISLLTNMRLYNGYHVETAEESYAWINLDDSKLLKEDAASEIEVRKDGKKLEVQLRSGNVFFDVAEPLEDDESLNIRTSTMIVGVRGTSGWIQVVDRWRTRISVLEGTVECTVTDPVTGQLKSEEIRGGETAECVVYQREQASGKCDILMKKYPVAGIPGFVLTDLTRDMALCDKIEAASGLDVPRELASVAGGDPSGRTPDRENATPEVLGEADRREDADEDALREEIAKVEEEVKKQEASVSPSKPISKPTAPDSGTNDRDSGSSSSGDSGTTTPDPTPTPPQTHGMKLTDVEVQALLDAASSVSIAPNTDAADTTPKKNTLEVDTGLTVAAGKTLDLQSGIDVEVYPGKTLRVDGTLAADALQNNGTTTVTSGNTLHLRGNLTTSGTLTVTATGRVVVDGTFTSTGAVALTTGAKVLAKAFAPNAAPEGWEVSAEADASGYYCLTPVEPEPTPPTYSITFDAVGGLVNGANSSIVHTDTTGKAVSWPADPTYGAANPPTPSDGSGLTFSGWFTAKAGGTQANEDTAFTADTTLYAHWDGWYLDSEGTLVIGGEGSMRDYFNMTAWIYAESITVADWYNDTGRIKEGIILEGVTDMYGDSSNRTAGAFYVCSNLVSVTIPSSVTSIGDTTFMDCRNLTSITIPEGVTSIGVSAFAGCSGLASVEIPSGVTSIDRWAFDDCTSLNEVIFKGTVAEWEALRPNVGADAIPASITVIRCSDGDAAP